MMIYHIRKRWLVMQQIFLWEFAMLRSFTCLITLLRYLLTVVTQGDESWCIRSSSPVKVLKILQFGEIFGDDDDIEEQIKQVKHFLKTMPNLEQLILYYDTSFDEDVNEVSSQLQWHPRVSSSKCRIQVISDNLSLSSIVPSPVTTKWGRLM